MRLVVPQRLIRTILRNQALNAEEPDTKPEQEPRSAETIETRLADLWAQGGDIDQFITEIDSLSQISTWKGSNVDIVIHHKLFNVIDELLERLSDDLERGTIGVEDKIMKAVKFLKVAIIYASSVHFFSSSERIIKLYKYYNETLNLEMLGEIVNVLITLTSKQIEKRPQFLQGVTAPLDRLNEELKEITEKNFEGLIALFDFFIDLMKMPEDQYGNLFEISIKNLSVQHQKLVSSVDQAASLENRKYQLQRLASKVTTKIQVEEVLTIIFRYINVYLNTGNLNKPKCKHAQSTVLEQLLPPKLLVRKIIQLLQTQTVAKKIHVQAMNMLFLFMMLDLNQTFAYLQTADNPYYAEACAHHEFYLSLLQSFARYHAFEKLDQQDEEQQAVQRELVATSSEETALPQVKSQRYLNSFLNFLCNLFTLKNKPLQTQMYPQLLKPLLALVFVRPTAVAYPINISTQLKAAKLLKEVIKTQSLDDQEAVQRLIARLKEEMALLHQPERVWVKFADDDCENETLPTYRHDLIRTFLRLLSSSILRNDPNAINFNQNFVANSRKILDSQLLQETMMREIFEPNAVGKDDYLQANVDPVIYQCLQLVSYVFNDLPQKIPVFIENGYFKAVLESLQARLPIQPDLVVLLLKFLQTLCLNHQGSELIASGSSILSTFAETACKPAAHKHFVNANKVMLFSDMTQQLAASSKPVAVAFFKAIIANFDLLVDQAWHVTELYVTMEETVKGKPKEEQESARVSYDREQINLEKTFETCSNLLFFFIDSDSGSSFPADAIKACQDQAIATLTKVVTTPLVASACSNMFPVFIEALVSILRTLGDDLFASFINNLHTYIGIQLQNLQLLIGDFDTVDNVERALKPDAELVFYELQPMKNKELLARLEPNDKASVVFGKLAFYCEVVYKSPPNLRVAVVSAKTGSDLFKLQALINRYHASKYQSDILKEKARLKELIEDLPEVAKADYGKFQPSKEPMTKEDEAMALFFKYEVEKVQSLKEERARESFKTAIELQLDENISHTSNMCQIAVRKLLFAFLRQLNRTKFHSSEKLPAGNTEINRLVGGLIAEEFIAFRPPGQDETEAMRCCCQFSAVLSEFNKVLFGTWSSGALFQEFFNRGGFEAVKEMVLWLVEYLYAIEKDQEAKSLILCKNVQLLWSHIVDFFVQLFETKYIDSQFHHFVVAFPDGEPGLRNYLAKVFTKAGAFLFGELNQSLWVHWFEDKGLSVFSYFDRVSELFLVTLLDIYNHASKGFKHAFKKMPKELSTVLAHSFKDFLRFVPSGKVVRKGDVIDNFYFKAFVDDEDSLRILKQATLELINDGEPFIVGHLALSLTNMLSYQHGALMKSPDEVFNAVSDMVTIFLKAVQVFKQTVSFRPDGSQPWDKDRDRAVAEQVRQLELAIQLFMYVTEEGKIASDLGKIGSILDHVEAKDLKESLERLATKNKKNVFEADREVTAALYQKFTTAMIELFKSMHMLDPKAEALGCLQDLVNQALNHLSFLLNIRGFSQFDCQTTFLKGEGIRALLGIKAYSTVDLFPDGFQMSKDQKKLQQIQIHSKIVLQMLSQNEATMIRTYENLIKSVLFIYFQERSREDEPVPKRVASPGKPSKSKDRSALLRRSEYGEVPLKDFIAFFDQVMRVQDFKSFLTACQNVCVIKKKLPPVSKSLDLSTALANHEEEEQKRTRSKRQEEKKKTQKQLEAQKEEHYISLNHKALKDMIAQNEQQLVSFSLGVPAEVERQLKGQIQPFQQDIVFTLLDQLIEQLRDQHMLILQHCKQPANPSPLGLQSRLDDRGRLVVKGGKLSYQSYTFDYLTIMSNLTFLITHSPVLVRCLLRHKDGKTFKFLIRNLYFLMTMAVQEADAPKEYTIYFDHAELSKQRVDIVREFFKRVMLDNPHLTASERRAKLDARVLFQKEVLRNLQEHQASSYPLWPYLRTVFSVGAVWLLSVVLKEEEKEEQKPAEDKNVESLVLNMQKYRNIFRQNLVKALINESQQHHKAELQVLALVQAIQRDVKEALSFFDGQKEPIQFCIQALTNILRPFEATKAVWGAEPSSNKLLSLGDLGFVQAQPEATSLRNIDIEEEESEESDEDDLLEDDDDDEDEDEDEMLSDTSERNMRFSQNNQLDEEDEEMLNEEEEADLYGDEDEEVVIHHHLGRGDNSPSDFEDEGNEDEEEGEIYSELLADADYGAEEPEDDEDFDESLIPPGAEAVEDHENQEEDYDEEYDDSADSDSIEYDEEYGADDDQEDEQIAIGRNQESMWGPAHSQRRDDILSMNNMSIDMMNVPRRQAREDMSQDLSQDASSVEVPRPPQQEAPQQNQRMLATSQLVALDEITGIINAVTMKLPSSSFDENQAAYNPDQTLTMIVQLNKEIQNRFDIYTSFIREVPGAPSAHKVPEAPPANTDQQEVVSTKSQFSSKNPFLAPPPLPQNLFLRQEPLALRPTRPQNQIPMEDLEIDPEFMENLDQTGLQNIAETENLMNQISNQSRPSGQGLFNLVQLIESIRNREEREQVLRNLPQSEFNQLPPHLMAEGLILRQLSRNTVSTQTSQIQLNFQNAAGQTISTVQVPNFFAQMRSQIGGGNPRVGNTQRQRSRLQSLDQQLNDITDFSRQPNDPYIMNNRQDSNVQIQFLQGIKDDLGIKDNKLLISFIQYLQFQLIELAQKQIFDSKSTQDISVSSEQAIITTLAQLDVATEQGLHKLEGMLEMIMVWIKFMTNGLFILQKEHNLMKSLLRVPYIRQGLILKTLTWLSQGVHNLQMHHEVETNKRQQTAFVDTSSRTLSLNEQKLFVARGNGLPGTLDIHNQVLQCLRCFKYLTTSQSLDQPPNQKRPIPDQPVLSLLGLELLKVPQEDVGYLMLAKREGNICESDSILSQIVTQIVTFLSIVEQCPAYLTGSASSDDLEHEVFWEETLSVLSSIFKQVATSLKLNYEAKDQPRVSVSLQRSVVQKLCNILLTTEFKSRAAIRSIKAIFTDIQSFSGEGHEFIQGFFKHTLSEALEVFVALIQTERVDVTVLKKRVTVINSILKFAKTKSSQEANICDQDQFFLVVKAISTFIDSKQFDSIASSTQQAAIMFKEEFRTIISTLFILFEYNLKFIFTDSSDEIFTSTKKRSDNKAPNEIVVIMQDAEEIKREAEQGAASSKERGSIMEAIDQHLQMKIKDQHARDDNRLKIFIKFCLEHKKLINSFIRANQQVLNDSLRNVLMKVAPQILDFDNKRLLFRSQIKKIQKKYRLKYLDLQVRRDQVFADSYEQLKRLTSDQWKGQMGIEFTDEQGIDEGGLTREWFILISQEIFNPDLALFMQSNAGTTYYPNPQSVVETDYISLFKFVGRIVGKALYEQQLLDCYFVKAFYKIILGLPLTYHDVEDFDNDLYRNLKWCLDNSVEGLGLTFSETRDYFGQSEEIEIIEGGKDLDVKDENKFDYVQRMAYQKLYNSIKKQVDSFLQGFYDIIPKALIQIFDNRELELLISGLPNIDIMDLKENTVYQNYTAETPVVKWLFEVLEEFDNSERAEFIQFVTGSSKVPVEGFKGLRGSRGLQKFQIVKFFTNDVNRLPQAHTCFKQLELPEYTSKEQLKERLLTAIKEGKTFGIA